MQYHDVTIDDIEEAPFLPSLSYGRDYGWLQESIASEGLLSPPLLWPAGDGRYRLVCGRARIEVLLRRHAKKSFLMS